MWLLAVTIVQLDGGPVRGEKDSTLPLSQGSWSCSEDFASFSGVSFCVKSDKSDAVAC